MICGSQGSNFFFWFEWVCLCLCLRLCKPMSSLSIDSSLSHQRDLALAVILAVSTAFILTLALALILSHRFVNICILCCRDVFNYYKYSHCCYLLWAWLVHSIHYQVTLRTKPYSSRALSPKWTDNVSSLLNFHTILISVICSLVIRPRSTYVWVPK